MELKCKVQNYEWGKKGLKSQVAKLYKNASQDIKIEENKPYAELWMGTHVNAPSIVKENGKLLASALELHPEYLGEESIKTFGEQLPFLFKVLSINKPLSIQAHPSKELAEKLHKEYPDIYKDPNHKPELAIALTQFEALCGFRPINEIKTFIKVIPELRNLVGNIQTNSDAEFLKKSFTAVLSSSKEKLGNELKNLLKRFKTLDQKQSDEQCAPLVKRLNTEFPNDVGCFVIYFLNYLKLAPSEAIYLGANEPHAYLSGDCVECMACSDNVVRAGLTPKFIDVKTLCSMLHYESARPEDKLFKPIREDQFTQIFKPPVKDFAVAEIKIPATAQSYTLIKRKTASILIVISGSATGKLVSLEPGVILFIPANTNFEIIAIKKDLEMYQALTNI